MKSRKILGLGSLPPPRGGVSVFFERWATNETITGATLTLINLNNIKRKRFSELLKIFGFYDEVLINNIKPMLIFLVRFFHPFATITIVDHNESRYFCRDGYLKKVIRNIAYSLSDKINVVSEHLVGGYALHHRKVNVITSFFAPALSDFGGLFDQYGEELKTFVNTSQGPKLLISAWRPIVEDGCDLYGLQSAIKLVTDLRSIEPEIRLVIVVGDPVENSLWRDVTNAATAVAIREHIRIETGQKELWPLLRCVDVMLRLTPTDGNSVSVHEALWAGCEVVASDVVPRPNGVLTYTYGNQDDLMRQVLTAWNNRKARNASRA